MFSNYAAIVEGHTEKHFFEMTLPKVHAIMSVKNGQDKNVLINSIVVGFRTLPRSKSTVFIVFDRERLLDTPLELTLEVQGALAPYVDGRTVHIGVPDRDIETWILADEEQTKKLFNEFKFEHEGQKCKQECQRILATSAPKKKAEALKKARPSVISRNSQSFKLLYDSYTGDWPWMKK